MRIREFGNERGLIVRERGNSGVALARNTLVAVVHPSAPGVQ
jgi:hypothetical protein